jgi:hypothetical protein
MTRHIKLACINIVVLIALVVSLESIAYLGRVFKDRPSVGFLVKVIDIPKNDYSSPLHPCNLMKTHPILNHVVDNPKNLCKVRGGTVIREFISYDANDNLPIILTLGGSTTSGFYQGLSDGKTWPYLLHQKIIPSGQRVLNGGHGAYGSTQELLKLIIDGRRIDGNLSAVISLNGINDIPSYPNAGLEVTANRFPFLTGAQQLMLNKQVWVEQRVAKYDFLPNLRSLFKYINQHRPLEDFPLDEEFKSINAVQRWVSNVKAMEAISQSMGAQYFVFLQPILGLDGTQSIPPKDISSNDFALMETLTADYLKELNGLFNKLKIECKLLDFCFDITQIAPPTGDNYHDIRHHNAKGNDIISDAIFAIVSERL